MTNTNAFELLYRPRERLGQYITPEENEPEMSVDESAFLCGLIKKTKPTKILELGVAGGGTTSIILECLDELGMNNISKVFSVDLNEDFYRGDGRKTGFMAREYMLNKKSAFRHSFILGNYLPDIIDGIGGDIDFLVLDTVHSLPGELLDYLVVRRYLRKDAIVVLHDISYQLSPVLQGKGISNTVLFNSIHCKDKCFPLFLTDKDDNDIFPNIGAWAVDNTDIEDPITFLHMLTIPWEYMPGEEEIQKYATFYSGEYGDSFGKRFLAIADVQKDYLKNRIVRSFKGRVYRALRMLAKGQ